MGSLEIWVRMTSIAIFACLIPLAIMISRERLRHYRRELLIALEEWMLGLEHHKSIPSFESARIKYELSPREVQAKAAGLSSRDGGQKTIRGADQTRDSWISYILPGFIYSALTAICFITAILLSADETFWSAPNFILSGMHPLKDGFQSDDLTVYQWHSGAAIIAGFVGAYLFSLQYLVQRVRSYELSPMSFLVASISILEGCFVVAIVRHLLPDEAVPQLIAIAFIFGYFPTIGVIYLVDKLKIFQLKSVDREAYKARSLMPTDIIDGIDILTKFRLMESGIRDVQNLATANPVLVYVETPYGLLTILDWIAQAQLILAVGGSLAANLRSAGIRTIFDIRPLSVSKATRKMVLGMVNPTFAEDASVETFEAFYQMLTQDIHVRRLSNFWEMMECLVDREGGATRDHPKSHATDDIMAAEQMHAKRAVNGSGVRALDEDIHTSTVT